MFLAALVLFSGLLGCSSELGFTSEQPGCVDVDLNDPAPPELKISQQNLSVVIRRTNVFKSCDAVFDPELSVDGNVVTIREYWVGGGDTASEDGCDTCWSPTVTMSDPPSRKLEYRWYLEGADVPFDTVEFKVD